MKRLLIILSLGFVTGCGLDLSGSIAEEKQRILKWNEARNSALADSNLNSRIKQGIRDGHLCFGMTFEQAYLTLQPNTYEHQWRLSSRDSSGNTIYEYGRPGIYGSFYPIYTVYFNGDFLLHWTQWGI
jgi:hypothetical protein